MKTIIKVFSSLIILGGLMICIENVIVGVLVMIFGLVALCAVFVHEAITQNLRELRNEINANS